MGKRGGVDSTGYHTNAPPKDKSDPNWQPRRDGKKAQKQQLLFERKYQEFLEAQGVPSLDFEG